MAYSYEVEKRALFTQEGVDRVMKVRDKAIRLLGAAGAVQAGRLLLGTGTSWEMMAAVDFLVERGDLVYFTGVHSTAWQHQILIAGPGLKL